MEYKAANPQLAFVTILVGSKKEQKASKAGERNLQGKLEETEMAYPGAGIRCRK